MVNIGLASLYHIYLRASCLFHGFFLTPQTGFEPVTNRLTADCSTTELLRIVFKKLKLPDLF